MPAILTGVADVMTRSEVAVTRSGTAISTGDASVRGRRKRALFICGSINQTTQMHRISEELPEYESTFTPHYGGAAVTALRNLRLLECTPVGFKLRRRCLDYLHDHQLKVHPGPRRGTYDLVVTCSDLVVPGVAQRSPLVLVQEGMVDPEGWVYRYAKRFPRWIGRALCTSTTGLSDFYQRFCVASEGFKDIFIEKGINPEKLRVTGIPNFDNCAALSDNPFPHRDYVLVCTSDMRETYKNEDRIAFIKRTAVLAKGRQLIFKLHPNERAERATREVKKVVPSALVFREGRTDHMIANCSVLITQFSSVVFVGMALGKEVYSYFDMKYLNDVCPLQNGGTSAARIANICRELTGLEARSSYTEAAE